MSLYEYTGYVRNVVDGDTIDCDVNLGFNISVRERFRLAKIDAPELYTKEGEVVKAKVIDMLEGKTVTLQVGKKDVYGRWLATVIKDGIDINNLMLKEKLAVPYPKRKL